MIPPVEAGSIEEIAVTGVTSEGAGVGRLSDGRAVFVHRTAPAERVRVRVTEVRKRWARAELVEVLEPSPARRDPPCRYYDRCGGCTLEHLTYDAQLEAKAALVTDALQRIGKRTDLPRVEVHPSPKELRYRNRVTLKLRRGDDGSVAAGFHALENPDGLVDLDGECLLFEEAIAEAWDGLRSAWGEGAARLPPGSELRVALRALASGGVILLVEGGTADLVTSDARSLLEAVPGLRAVWDRAAARERPRLAAGEERLAEVWYGEEVEVHPHMFLQSNREAAEHLHELVLREAGGTRGKRVVDAYAGIAIYGRRLARAGAVATAIEVDPFAAEVAEERTVKRDATAKEDRTSREEGHGGTCRVLVGRVEERLSEALPADLVILNPPRVGVADGVMQELAAAETERILYVSCDPATLARDVRRLSASYRIVRLQVIDLFPQTAHVETLLTLERERAG